MSPSAPQQDTVAVDLGGREVRVPQGACTTATGWTPTST